MKLFDISRELFSAGVYPGDPPPFQEAVRRMDLGDEYNLSAFFTGCHCGTHLDAPRHYMEDGPTIDRVSLDHFVGRCSVITMGPGLITGDQIDRLLPVCEKIILFRGEGETFLSQSAAFALADGGVTLVGTDAQSIAPYQDERSPHLELLMADIPILEGLELSEVPDGTYTLIAFPLKLQGLEASPCRAVLIDELI